MHTILRFVASVVALYLTVYVGKALLPGIGLYLAPGMAGIEGAGIAALLLGIVNALIRPILKLIALPITCLTLGLFSIVINALLFWLVGQFTPNYHVSGWEAPLFGTICMGLVSAILNLFLNSGDDDKKASQGS